MVYQTDPLRDPRWLRLAQEDPHASIFHSVGWLAALQRTYGYEPVAFSLCSPEAQELNNSVLFCRVQSWLTGRRLVSLPFSDHCDFLGCTSEGARVLLGKIVERQGPEWRYVEVRPRSGATSMGQFPGMYSEGEYILHVLDLQPSIEELFRSFHKDSVQRKILRAEREGLTYEEGRSEELLQRFYQLFLMTRRRHRLPPQPLEWFQNLAHSLGEALKVRVAAVAGKPVAAIITIYHRQTMVYKYGCSDARYHNLGGVPFLFWRAIQEAKQMNMVEFDFGRTELHQEGLATFKDRWGTQREALRYWRTCASRTAWGHALWPARLAGHIVSRAPQPLLTWAGKVFYRHMG
jgi:hypothetical protein